MDYELNATAFVFSLSRVAAHTSVYKIASTSFKDAARSSGDDSIVDGCVVSTVSRASSKVDTRSCLEDTLRTSGGRGMRGLPFSSVSFSKACSEAFPTEERMNETGVVE